jgi:HECT-domain (ubiquitin-transferase)
VHAYPPALKLRLLEFVTASDRVPVGGEANITFVIQRNGPDSERVPTSLTCFGRLLVPEYRSRRKLKEKLRIALENGKGFGVP